jgi:hypothetical protein
MKGIDISPPSTCRQGRAKWTYLNANGRPVTNGRRIDARFITTCLTAQCFASRNLKDWATPDEVEAAITELRELWKRCGKEMMAAKAKAGGAWDQNWFDRTDAGNALCERIIVAQDARATINAIVKLLKLCRRVCAGSSKTRRRSSMPSWPSSWWLGNKAWRHSAGNSRSVLLMSPLGTKNSNGVGKSTPGAPART